MGWGEPRDPDPGEALAKELKRYIMRPTTGNFERIKQALDRYYEVKRWV